MKKTRELANKTATYSSQSGCEVLKRECDHLESDWEDYLARISQAEEDVTTALVTWGDFETKFAACSTWLKDMEEQVKNYELKNTLQEKQNQIEKFKVGHALFCFVFFFFLNATESNNVRSEFLYLAGIQFEFSFISVVKI